MLGSLQSNTRRVSLPRLLPRRSTASESGLSEPLNNPKQDERDAGFVYISEGGRYPKSVEEPSNPKEPWPSPASTDLPQGSWSTRSSSWPVFPLPEKACPPPPPARDDCEQQADEPPQPTDNQQEIKRVRNDLHAEGGTVMFSRILFPMLEHGSAGIYAPDEIILKLFKAVRSKVSNLSAGGLGASAGTDFLPWLSKGIQENRIFCAVVLVAGMACMMYKTALIGFFETAFMGWALYNQSLTVVHRGLSISALMIVRLLVSNLLPFTSPAFAFLIQMSLPQGEEWMGTLYLLVCSMPAGLVVPVCDKLMELLRGPLGQARDGQGLDRYDHHFQATAMFAKVTDHLPFSFWVRPVFMEPAFRMIKKGLGAEDKSAAAGAVLAGHFMIWAGPATTMYQRLFVPDWITCIFIQPLGLMEDVAVVLAAWAGSSPANGKQAELCMYLFMLCMNAVQLAATSIQHGRPSRKQLAQHATVGLLTLLVIGLTCCMDGSPMGLVVPPSSPPAASPGGEPHTNLKAAGALLVWVSFLAVLFRLAARAVTSVFHVGEDEEPLPH